MFIADVMQQGGGVVSEGCALLGLYSKCSASVSDCVYQWWCIDESVDQTWCSFRVSTKGCIGEGVHRGIYIGEGVYQGWCINECGY